MTTAAHPATVPTVARIQHFTVHDDRRVEGRAKPGPRYSPALASRRSAEVLRFAQNLATRGSLRSPLV